MGISGTKRDRRPTWNRHAIIDRAGLAAAVGILFEKAGGGVAAAAKCGFPQSRALLYGLRDQTRAELTDGTLRKLQAGFEALNLPVSVADYLASPSEAEASVHYKNWLERWAERLVMESEADEGVLRYVPSPAKGSELQALASRAKSLVKRELNGFVEFASRRGHSQERIAVAAYRVFEPLLEVRSSGYTELGHEELRDEEFARFVRNGLSRERILLHRKPDVQRLRNTDARRTSAERRKFENSSNPFERRLQSRGLRRKRPNIADALSGKRWPEDYPVQVQARDLTRWVPRECWELSTSSASGGRTRQRTSPADRQRAREQSARQVQNARFLEEAKAKRGMPRKSGIAR